jgi:hypothetical protein
MSNQDFLITEEQAQQLLQGQSAPKPSTPGLPPQIVDPYASGVASSLGTDVDTIRSQMPGTLPTFRLMPTSPSGDAKTGAAAQSTLLKNPTFVQNVAQTNVNTTDITANTNAIADLEATSFQGAWSATVSYAQGASVDYSGTIYVSLVNNNLNNTPSSSPTDWVAAGGSGSYLGAWSGAVNYTTGQIVSVSTSLYIALQNSINQNPTSTTGYWQLVSGSTTYYGTYSGSQAYNAGSEVTYNGSFWIALAATTGNTPTPGSSFWVNVGTAAILLTAYSGSVTYSIGMEATLNGNVYKYTNATPSAGNTPPNVTYWTLVGTSVVVSQGINACYNGGFEINQGGYPTGVQTQTGYLVDGWSFMDCSQYQAALLDNTSAQSGHQDLEMLVMAAGQSIPSNNTYYECRVLSQPIPVTPGEVLQFSGYIGANVLGGLVVPAGVNYIARLGLFAYDASGNQLTGGEITPFADVTAPQAYTLNSAQVTIAATYGGVAPSYVRVECAVFIRNNSGSTFSTTLSQIIVALFDNIIVAPVTVLGTTTNEGPTQYFQSSASLSYIPTSDPLTSSDSGGGVAQINVASWTLQTARGTVSYNSGSVLSLSYGTLFYVYLVDSGLVGGSPTYLATTNKSTAVSGLGNIYIGSITTAISGGTPTNQQTSGGVGAQYGSQPLFLGGSATATNTVGPMSTSNPGNMIDGNPTTKCVATTTSSSGIASVLLTVDGFSPTGLPYSSLTLYVRSAVPTNPASGITCTCEYSLNGGSSFTTIWSVSAGTTRALTTDTVSLPTSQNLGLLQVLFTPQRAGGTVVAELDVYEVYVIGVV